MKASDWARPVGLLLSVLSAAASADSSGSHMSRHAAFHAQATVVQGATIIDGKGGELRGASLLIAGGRIIDVGAGIEIPGGATVVHAEGKWLTPGIIDVHSHLGTHSVGTPSDAHEMTGPNTAGVWMEHSVWPQDPGFDRALRAGVTTMQVMPGSSNVFGGRTVVLKNVPARTVAEMKFPGAPHGLKMACGEGPKFIYAARGEAPGTRMGSIAIARGAWLDAQHYLRDKGKRSSGWMDGLAGEQLLKLQTLGEVLEGRARVHVHCYRADDIASQLEMAKEYRYAISGIHHASEAYKIADVLARARVCSAVWADWWGFRPEAHDGIPENAAMLEAVGACVAIHSDSATGIQYLNHAAAKAYHAGRAAGILDMPRAEVWKWISANPARMLGIDHVTGSIEPGKAADIVIWNGDPLSVYTLVDQVLIDGVLRYDRSASADAHVRDFERGHAGEGDRK